MTPSIFITGCSTGIGRATAFRFAASGWNVVATMRDPAAADGLEALPNVLVLPLDVTDPAAIDAAAAQAEKTFGTPDAIVNNAGYAALGALEAIAPAEIERQFETNVFGLIATTRAFLPRFRARGSGTIVNISSIVGRVGYPLGSIYNASKFAVEGFSEALSYEVAEFGGRVRIIEPGLIRSDFGSRSMMVAHDPALAAYGRLMGALGRASQAFAAAAEPPEIVADAVWEAVNDPSERLRYPAGAAAESALQDRARLDDAALKKTILQRFAL